MEIVFKSNSSLPPLAWAAEVTKDLVTIHHGTRVETGDDWLLDGCWPGRFESGLPEEAVDGFFAFGLRVRNDIVQIDTPAHPLERLHIWRDAARLIASPSLAFVLTLANAAADPSYPDYLHDVFHVIQRISQNSGSIPLAGGQTVQVIANRRVLIMSALDVRVEYRPFERSFRDFQEYKSFLCGVIAAVRDNALSPARRAGAYRLTSSISSGYDSLALNVLAAPLGWKEAVTFSIPGDTDDSGEAFGPRLGMEIHPIDRHAYRRLPNLPEAEFLATGARGEDVVFAGAEPFLKNSLFVTGTAGDWLDKNLFGIQVPDIVRSNTTACSLGEFRWRLGFLHAPIFHAGGQGLLSFKAISHSEEMAPWSIGGKYDRPISRRIIEESGLPRGSFAHTKFGSMTVAFHGADERLREFMNPESFGSLQEFRARHRSSRTFSSRLRRAGKYSLYRAERFVGHHLLRAGLLDHAPDSFAPRHKSIPGLSSYILPWALGLMTERYRPALSSS